MGVGLGPGDATCWLVRIAEMLVQMLVIFVLAFFPHPSRLLMGGVEIGLPGGLRTNAA